jgi:gliding motility-associated-like protein
LDDAVAPTTLPTVTNSCGDKITPTGPVVGGSMSGSCGTKTYTYTYTDCAGHNHTWTYTYTIATNFNLPANGSTTVSCIDNAIAPTLPTVIDAYSNVLNPVGPPQIVTNVTNGCGTRTYTYSYEYCSGLTKDWTYTYTVTPVNTITVSAVIASSTVGCISAAAAPAVLPTITDACGRTLSPSAPVEGGSVTNGCGTKTYTYTYTDCAGNVRTWTYTYTILPGAFTIPAISTGSTVACPSAAVAPTLPKVTDPCGNILTPSEPVISGTATIDCGTRIYTYTYTDCAGNTKDWTYTYTIIPGAFTIPMISTGSTVDCPANAVAPTLPTVTDVCGNKLTPVGPVISGTATTGCGTRIYTYTYTDCAGNTQDWTYTYTIKPGTIIIPTVSTGSIINCPADAVTPAPPKVTDLCGNVLTPVGPVVSGTATTGCGTRIYTYTYTDCAGNTQDWVYTYTVIPGTFTIPTISTSRTVNCPADAVAPTLPKVADLCGNILIPVGPVISGTATTGCGTRIYTYTYTDCAGNTQDWVYTYTVIPGAFTIPTISTSSTVYCPAAAVAPTLPAVTDACGNKLTPGGPVISGAITGYGVKVYTYTYTDCAGNTQNWVYTYTIELVIPVIHLPEPIMIICRKGAITLNASVTPSEAILKWYDANNKLVGTGGTIAVNPPQTAGSYHSEHIYKVVASLCEQEVHSIVKVSVDESLTGEVTGDFQICKGNSTRLNAASYDAASYVWTSPGYTGQKSGALQIERPEETTIYYVDMERGVCRKSDTIVVEVSNIPAIDRIDLLEARTVEIILEDDRGISPIKYKVDYSSFDDDPVKYGLLFGKRTFHVIDDFGCISEPVTYIVETPGLIIPPYFSPNGDGINDTWEVENLKEFYPNAIVTIYDRHGKQLVQYKGSNTGWDGKYLGRDMPTTDYWYVIDLYEINKQYKGHFTLLRK